MRKIPLTQYVILCPMVVLLGACASSVKQGYIAAGTDPQAAITEIKSEMAVAKSKGHDKISPEHFEEAKDYVQDAQEKIEKGKSSEAVLMDLRKAKGHLEVVDTNAAQFGEAFKAVLTARTAAVDAGALSVLPKKFKKAEEEFEELGEDAESGKDVLSSNKISKVQQMYLETELEAVKVGRLSEAKSQFEAAEKNNAKRYAEKTWEKAKLDIKTAEASIEANRRNENGYSTEVEAAVESATKLAAVTNIARNMKLSEENAIRVYEQQRQISGLTDENSKFTSEAELRAAIAKAKESFGKDEAEVLQDGNNKLVVRLKKMNFSPARSEISTQSMSTLAKVKELLNAVPVSNVTIEGHTDSTGTTALNQALSEQRAESVKEYFVSQGVLDEEKVTTEGYGFEKPLSTNRTKEGRAMNRRVDIVIESQKTF